MQNSDRPDGGGHRPKLTGKQRSYLKGLGNRLSPAVYVGKDGISPAVLRSVAEAHHTGELIKIKRDRSCPLERKDLAGQLAEATSSHLVGVLGQTILLYRPDPEEPRLQLPD